MDSPTRVPTSHRVSSPKARAELAPLEIVALSPGLGLGKLRSRTPSAVVAAKPLPGSKAATASLSIEDRLLQQVPAAPAPFARESFDHSEGQAKDKSAPMPAAQLRGRQAPRWVRVVMAFSCDFLFVGVTLAGAMALAAGVATARGEDWLSAPPLSWLAVYAPWQVLVGVYSVFLAYLALFKGVAGRTLGEILVGPRRRQADR